MVYKFRVILDTEEDIFRDIAIMDSDTLEDLHNAIVNAFGFDGTEIASFYRSDDEWSQGEEIPLFDTGDVAGEQRTMAEFILADNLDRVDNKIIYVYDFLNMWTFFVELAAIEEPESGATYPDLLFSHGEMPANAPEHAFGADGVEDDLYGEFDDDYDEEDLDMFDDDQSFGEMDDHNWN